MRTLLLTGFLALLCAPGSASSQTTDASDAGTYDIACPATLNSYFQVDYHGVDYAGEEWLSQWRAISSARPLPSRTWYYAYPNRHIKSRDNSHVWEYAEIRVHCWVYRAMYLTVVHYDPIDYRGYVKPASSNPGSGSGTCDDMYMTSLTPTNPEYELSTAAYDPYDPSCVGSGGGGGGDGGDGGVTFPEMCSSLGGKLYYDYLCLEQWNANTGNYETVWCGVAAICET
jgi:hypothetical protein